MLRHVMNAATLIRTTATINVAPVAARLFSSSLSAANTPLQATAQVDYALSNAQACARGAGTFRYPSMLRPGKGWVKRSTKKRRVATERRIRQEVLATINYDNL
jgi:hypothetical protein